TSAAATPKSASVPGEPQPWPAARVDAETSSIRPAVIVAAPATSKCRCAKAPRPTGRSSGVSTTAAIPTGTLMKNTQDQLRYEVSPPPTSTPPAAPEPEAAP